MTITSSRAPNDSAFEYLKAEDEAAWLSQVFIPPTDFDTLLGTTRLLVFGERGSGKTAVRLALLQQIRDRPMTPVPLIVEWQPSRLMEDVNDSQVVHAYIRQMLEACAIALLRHLTLSDLELSTLPHWVKEAVGWFIQKYSPGDWQLQLERQSGEAPTERIENVRALLAGAPRSLISPNSSEQAVISEFANLIKRVGLNSVWVMVDQLETWLELEDDRVAELLKILFKALYLFEIPGFGLKMMVPREYEPILRGAGAIATRRLTVHHLDWSLQQLVSIVERRLALALGRQEFHLGNLSTDNSFQAWLEEYGGRSPHAWLKLTQPFFVAYRTKGALKPLTSKEMNEVQRAQPPQLRFDPRSNQVFLANKPVTGVTGIPLKLLRHLFAHRVCTRANLYYHGYKGLTSDPKEGDKEWDDVEIWRGMMDTHIYRLREAIEPDLHKPIYVVSKPNGHIALENAE